MGNIEGKTESRIEERLEVSTYISRLVYALENNNAKVTFQEERQVDKNRPIHYTNKYTVAQLFPNEDPVEAIKRELKTLKVQEYIETVKDIRFPKKSEMRVFGRCYGDKEVYIKIRVELIQVSVSGVYNAIFVMLFHFSTVEFKDVVFPYCKR